MHATAKHTSGQTKTRAATCMSRFNLRDGFNVVLEKSLIANPQIDRNPFRLQAVSVVPSFFVLMCLIMICVV